jgi:hypothetical protein
MHRRLATAIAVAAALFLLTASDASAQEETGKSCVADASAPNRTVIGFDPGQIFPVPLYELQARVITGWKVRVAPGTGPLAQQLVTFRQVGEEEDRKTGESAVETLSEGTNEFPTRLPITGFHPHVGLHGPVETLYCGEEKEMLAGVVEGQFGIGETRHYKVEVGIGAPVTVTVEPDRDGDGYGDLTQDACPQSAAFQVACPPVTLSSHAVAKRRFILLRVVASSEAQVHVYGQVSWGFKPKPGGHAGQRTGLVVGLSGGTKNVAPGKVALFKIPFSKPIMRRLGRLSPRESLKAMVTISAKDLAGRVTYRKLTVILKGQDTGA